VVVNPAAAAAGAYKFIVLEMEKVDGVPMAQAHHIASGKINWLDVRNPSDDLKKAIDLFEHRKRQGLGPLPTATPTASTPSSTPTTRRSKRVQEKPLSELRMPVEGESEEEEDRVGRKRRSTQVKERAPPPKSKKTRTSTAPIPATQYSREENTGSL
jgi:hypothetical protein